MPTIIYVTKTGNNANNGLTQETAKRTLFDAGANLGAYELAADGDTIKFGDGVFSGSEIEASAGAGYLLTAKGLTLDSINPFGATLASTVVTAVVRVSGAFANKALIIGSIHLDGDGVVPNYGVWFNPTSGPATLDLGKVSVKQAAFYGAYVSAANTVKVILRDDKSKHVTGRAAIDAVTLGAASEVTLKGTIAVILGKTVARPAINIKATAAGCKAVVSDPDVTIHHGSTFPANADGAVSILNIDNAVIKNPTVNVTSDSTVGTINALVIDCDNALLTAHRGKITGGTLNLNANGGIAAVIGHDTSNAADNLANFGLIKSVKINGGAKFIAGTGHAVMLGYTSDSNAYINDVNGAGIGCLMKAATRCHFNVNKARRCGSSFIQIKGCFDSTSDGNEIYLDDSAGAGIVANANGVTNSTGCTATGNTFFTREATLSKVVALNAGEGVALHQNTYAVLPGASLPGVVATVGATNYATLSEYAAANETDAEIIDTVPPMSITSGTGLHLNVAHGITIAL